MNIATLISLKSLEELRFWAAAWDDLWQRSEPTPPTARAEMLAQWAEQFAPDANFYALAVEAKGKWMAALPLIPTKVRHLLQASELCGRTWVPGGAFLFDAKAEAEVILDTLIDGLREIDGQLIWLKDVALYAPRWKAFQSALRRAAIPLDIVAEESGGYLPVNHDWQAYYQTLSKNNRKSIERRTRRLAERGQITFHALSRLSPREVERFLQMGMEIENQGWKGESQSSVLQRKEFQFLLRQAQEMAALGYLRLFFLKVGNQTAAFVYGFLAQGVFYGCKTGYHPAFAAESPGKLLYGYVLEYLHQQAECQGFDCFGQLTDALAIWRPQSFPLGRIAIAPKRLLGRLAIFAYQSFFKHAPSAGKL